MEFTTNKLQIETVDEIKKNNQCLILGIKKSPL